MLTDGMTACGLSSSIGRGGDVFGRLPFSWPPNVLGDFVTGEVGSFFPEGLVLVLLGFLFLLGAAFVDEADERASMKSELSYTWTVAATQNIQHLPL